MFIMLLYTMFIFIIVALFSEIIDSLKCVTVAETRGEMSGVGVDMKRLGGKGQGEEIMKERIDGGGERRKRMERRFCYVDL